MPVVILMHGCGGIGEHERTALAVEQALAASPETPLASQREGLEMARRNALRLLAAPKSVLSRDVPCGRNDH